jgi:hypothetical protein
LVLSLTRAFSPSPAIQSKANFSRLTNERPYSRFENVPSLYLGSALAATSLLGGERTLRG